MKKNSITIQTHDGLNLFYQSWEPDSAPRAVVCFLHGLGEHSNRYEHVAEFLVNNGFALHAIDLRGHGKSDGQRGHLRDIEDYFRDTDLLIQTAKQLLPDLPVFLYGHSLGAIIALCYTLSRKPSLQGVVATNPGFSNALKKQKLKLFLAKALGPIFPTISIPTGLAAAEISRDPEVVQKYLQEPLVHGQSTLGWAANLLRATDWAPQHASEFNLPLLLMHGTADTIAYAIGSQEFAASVRSDCTLKLWDGLTHEIHNEPEKDQVLAYLKDWLVSKL